MYSWGSVVRLAGYTTIEDEYCLTPNFAHRFRCIVLPGGVCLAAKVVTWTTARDRRLVLATGHAGL